MPPMPAAPMPVDPAASMPAGPPGGGVDDVQRIMLLPEPLRSAALAKLRRPAQLDALEAQAVGGGAPPGGAMPPGAAASMPMPPAGGMSQADFAYGRKPDAGQVAKSSKSLADKLRSLGEPVREP